MSKTYQHPDACDRCQSRVGQYVVKNNMVCLRCKRELKKEAKQGRKNGRNVHAGQEAIN